MCGSICGDQGGGAQAGTPAQQAAETGFTNTENAVAQNQLGMAENVFQPLQKQAAAEVQQFNSPQYAAQQEGLAATDVSNASAKARAGMDASNESMGVNPASGAWGANNRTLAINQAGQTASAVTGARRNAALTGFETLAQEGSGGNAAIGAATGAAAAGGNMVNQNIGLGLQQENINNQGMGGIGQLLGMGASMYQMSSKQFKTRVNPYTDGMSAIRKMPIKSYKYKPGVAQSGPINGTDPDTHTGPMAEDVDSATGGDGTATTVNIPDMLGMTMSAVKGLDKRVKGLEGART